MEADAVLCLITINDDVWLDELSDIMNIISGAMFTEAQILFSAPLIDEKHAVEVQLIVVFHEKCMTKQEYE